MPRSPTDCFAALALLAPAAGQRERMRRIPVNSWNCIDE
jgi:hypothetical protein